jgi:hypothetical protein
MKRGARLTIRKGNRTRAAATTRDAARTYPSTDFGEPLFLRQQMPLSFAPYQLRAADRWWQQEGSGTASTRKKSA